MRVDPSVVDTERGEAMWAYHVDHLTRQMDPGCAVNGSTKGFALLVPGQKSDRLLDLDEGGNTLAWDAFQASQTGQKVLNGEAPGEKPVATVVGTAHGDRLIVKTIRLEPPRKPSK